MTRVQRETVSYLVISAFSILMLVWAIPVYTPAYPGYGASPALVPVVSVCVMLVMSVLAIIRNIVIEYSGGKTRPGESELAGDAEESGFTQAGGIDIRHLAKFIAPCVLLIVGIDTIGYLPAAFLFMLLIQFVIGNTSVLRSLAVAIVSVAVMYIVMRYGFGVPVPGPQLF